MCMDIVVYSPSLLSMVMPYSAPNWYCKRLCTLLTPISRKKSAELSSLERNTCAALSAVMPTPSSVTSIRIFSVLSDVS